MKKILAALLITVLSTAASFANSNTGNAIPVNDKVLKTFNSEFTTASGVTWSELKQHGIFHASFMNDQQQYEAFITEDGELLATARVITKKQLSMDISSSLEKAYGKAYIDNNVTEIRMDGSTYYYLTVITEKATLIIKASVEGDLSVFQKQKSIAS